MSELVLAVACSHGPSIQNQPETWSKLAEKDVRDPRFNYRELLAAAKSGLDGEVALDVQRRRHAAAQRGLETLASRIKQADVDVFVVVSNAHHIRKNEPHPVFGILRADQFAAADVTGAIFDPGAAQDIQGKSRSAKSMPGQAALANRLIDGLIEEGFDVACIDQLPEGAMLDEAFSFCYKWLFADKAIPIVPFLLSRDLPNQATPERCISLGRALRTRIDACPLNLRVGLIASGGLSHQVVDEELDQQVVDALGSGDFKILSGLPRKRLNAAPGTPEILNWITLAGAMAPTNMELIDYLPCYRSIAGTGHGVAFGCWTPK
jgi:3-O-methylgallate 3,4-dioxygenase